MQRQDSLPEPENSKELRATEAREPPVIVLASLDPRRRERYVEALLEQDAQFEVAADPNGTSLRYTARLAIPYYEYLALTKATLDSSSAKNVALAFERKRISKMERTATSSKPPSRKGSDLAVSQLTNRLSSVYPALCSMISVEAFPTEQLSPRKLKPTLSLPSLVKIIDSVFDARYEWEVEEAKERLAYEQSGTRPPDDQPHPYRPFAAFVYAFYEKKYGLKKLVDKHLWDLLLAVDRLRGSSAAVELFAAALLGDETNRLNEEDLSFLLCARMVANDELARMVDGTTVDHIPLGECMRITSLVFGGAIPKQIHAKLQERWNGSSHLSLYQLLLDMLLAFLELQHRRIGIKEVRIPAHSEPDGGMISPTKRYTAGELKHAVAPIFNDCYRYIDEVLSVVDFAKEIEFDEAVGNELLEALTEEVDSYVMASLKALDLPSDSMQELFLEALRVIWPVVFKQLASTLSTEVRDSSTHSNLCVEYTSELKAQLQSIVDAFQDSRQSEDEQRAVMKRFCAALVCAPDVRNTVEPFLVYRTLQLPARTQAVPQSMRTEGK